jgi:hypothetical protein
MVDRIAAVLLRGCGGADGPAGRGTAARAGARVDAWGAGGPRRRSSNRCGAPAGARPLAAQALERAPWARGRAATYRQWEQAELRELAGQVGLAWRGCVRANRFILFAADKPWLGGSGGGRCLSFPRSRPFGCAPRAHPWRPSARPGPPSSLVKVGAGG